MQNPGNHPRLPGFCVYGVVNLYLTNFDDFREVYLFGIQADNGLTKETGL